MSAILQHFQRFARYNALANKRLFAAVGGLPAEEYRKERPAFFGSIERTLNHIMIGDGLWMDRFEGQGRQTGRLDEILYTDFDALWQARQREDRRISSFIDDKLTEEMLASHVITVNAAGERFEDPFAMALAHMFNHQTHHRGQVHDMLSQAGMDPPSLDMHRILNPEPKK